MRVVGGKYRGRRLHPPTRLRARPTTDFAKEGLFNVLQHSIELDGIEVLDLFAGTGAISLEFLSRGASSVVSVDTDKQAVSYIQKLAQEVQDNTWQVVRADAFGFLNTYASQKDIIFADPPFNLLKHQKLVTRVIEKKLLKTDGSLIIEHPKEVDLSEEMGYQNTRNYGNLNFSFFKP